MSNQSEQLERLKLYSFEALTSVSSKFQKKELDPAFLKSFTGFPFRFKNASLQETTKNNVIFAGTAEYVRICEYVLKLSDSYFKNGENNPFSVFLHGKNGVGKTYFACAIGNEFISNNLNVLYTNLDEIIAVYHSTKTFSSNLTTSAFYKQWVDVDLIIIDDFAREDNRRLLSETEKVLIFNLLDKRYQFVKPLVIVSEFSQTHIKHEFNQSMMSRIHTTDTVTIELTKKMNSKKCIGKRSIDIDDEINKFLDK